VKFLKIKKDDKSPAYEPTLENVKSGQYPLSRYLFWYLRNKPTGDLKKLVDFVLSAEGQEIVSKVGYFPVN
jgi:phosphate transport system substrate-binding protein